MHFAAHATNRMACKDEICAAGQMNKTLPWEWLPHHLSKQITSLLLQALNEYNETNAVMDLVLFEDAMKHVGRITRILSNPRWEPLNISLGRFTGKQ